ncbi:MAG: hypothetical protein HQK54_16870, partial [Oligoflexales bacterium]|nr:hypothetical protein [Oligoflexales bacterium]
MSGDLSGKQSKNKIRSILFWLLAVKTYPLIKTHRVSIIIISIYILTFYGLPLHAKNEVPWTPTLKPTADGLVFDKIYGIYAEGSNVYVATNHGLSISHDQGKTWIDNITGKKGITSNTIKAVYVAGSTIYLVGENKPDGRYDQKWYYPALGISISVDSGKSWINKEIKETIRDFDGFSDIRAFYVAGPNIYLLTRIGLLSSIDGGKSWNISKDMKIDSIPVMIDDVFTAGMNIYFATGMGLFISTDGGKRFDHKTTKDGLSSDIVTHVCAYGSYVYAYTKKGLSISKDGGKSWSNRTPKKLENERKWS